ncbi:MAG: SpoIIIAH-like family protein [Clostridiales bacterium]|nr:SpoIIIAH-like family protein [Clostridiales bacterium]
MSEKFKFMKKVVKKNQVIIAALAVMIIIAGYLNLTGMNDKKSAENGKTITDTSGKNEKNNDKTNKTSSDGYDITDGDIVPPETGEDEKVSSNDLDVTDNKVGDTIMAENFTNGHFMGNSKLDREQVRAANKETLQNIVSDKSLTDEAKKSAVDNLVSLTKEAGIEDELETLLEAKGYETVCYYGEKGIDVVVNKSSLSQTDVAKIEDVVTRKTDIGVKDIVITNVCVKD